MSLIQIKIVLDMVNYLVPTKHTTAKVTMQNYGETFGHYSTLKPEERYNYHISSQNSIIELIMNIHIPTNNGMTFFL